MRLARLGWLLRALWCSKIVFLLVYSFRALCLLQHSALWPKLWPELCSKSNRFFKYCLWPYGHYFSRSEPSPKSAMNSQRVSNHFELYQFDLNAYRLFSLPLSLSEEWQRHSSEHSGEHSSEQFGQGNQRRKVNHTIWLMAAYLVNTI